MHYILESTFVRIFLFLELTLQQETHINWYKSTIEFVENTGNKHF